MFSSHSTCNQWHVFYCIIFLPLWNTIWFLLKLISYQLYNKTTFSITFAEIILNNQCLMLEHHLCTRQYTCALYLFFCFIVRDPETSFTVINIWRSQTENPLFTKADSDLCFLMIDHIHRPQITLVKRTVIRNWVHTQKVIIDKSEPSESWWPLPPFSSCFLGGIEAAL